MVHLHREELNRASLAHESWATDALVRRTGTRVGSRDWPYALAFAANTDCSSRYSTTTLPAAVSAKFSRNFVSLFREPVCRRLSARPRLAVVDNLDFSPGDHSYVGTEQRLLVGHADSRFRWVRNETAGVCRVALFLVDIGVERDSPVRVVGCPDRRFTAGRPNDSGARPDFVRQRARGVV
jgi:hypothetical protein